MHPTTSPSSCPRLTVGMPTHMDAYGVYQTVMALLIYHREVMADTEIVVVDQSPESPHGTQVRNLLEWVKPACHSVKYVGYPFPQGSAPAKDQLFREATGEVVVCLDSHVFLFQGALQQTLDYFAKDALKCSEGSKDLLCGPLLYDDLKTLSTHLRDEWSGNQWGVWTEAMRCPCGRVLEAGVNQYGVFLRDPAYHLEPCYTPVNYCPACGNQVELDPAKNENLHNKLLSMGFTSLANPARHPEWEPFEVWAQGTGLLVCRKDAWVGFTPGMTGFGAEEVTLHHRFRRAGGKVLCCPWLRWVHRFLRVEQPKYNLSQYHHIRNYVLAFKDLGLDLKPVYDHFVGTELNGEPIGNHLMRAHAVPYQKIQGKTIVELEQIHKEQLFPEVQWQMILDGHPDPVYRTKGCRACEKQAQQPQTQPGTPDKAEVVNTPTNPSPSSPIISSRRIPAYQQTLETWYDHAYKTPHDINEHCPTLRDLASKCDHVTEFGKRHDVSTVALLAGVMSRVRQAQSAAVQHEEVVRALKSVLVSYHPFQYAEVRQLAEVGGSVYQFRVGDSLTTDIAETDLLFLDTIHRADRLLPELEKHYRKVRRYIVLHDTATYGEFGDGSHPPKVLIPGLLVAMRHFLKQHPEWTVVADYQNNHGLTVISIDERDKEPLPSNITMAWNYAKALAQHATKGGTASEEKFKRRLEICTVCPKKNGERCGRCGCPIIDKAAWDEQECPLNRWSENGV